jgi:acyl carrier protein phosphodiesterase
MNNYPERIRQGILLHRRIDEYTDHHPAVKEVVKMLRLEFGRYSGIVADMYFDYFLANHFTQFSRGKSLRSFARGFYIAALINYRYLPQRVKKFIFHFIGTNRLSQYQTTEGLKNSLIIMSNYKVPALQPDKIILFLLENSEEIESHFLRFFSELIDFVDTEIQRFE